MIKPIKKFIDPTGIRLFYPHFHLWIKILDRAILYIHIRIRRGEVWNHVAIIIWERHFNNNRRAKHKLHEVLRTRKPGSVFCLRPTVTIFEIKHWKTIGTVKSDERRGIKSYIRLKICLGGREITARSLSKRKRTRI